MSGADGPLLEIRGLHVTFDVDGETSTAVEDASISVERGEVVAVVGESGSGKSVTAMSVLGLLAKNATTSGEIRFDGIDLRALAPAELRALRGGRIAMIFQDPAAALNPVFTIGFQIAECVRLRTPGLSRAAVRERVIELLELVDIPEPARRLGQYPHQLSGGQCQRVVIAMGLASDPELLIADEPTTALDVTVQAEILDVLRRIRERYNGSILVITHDMGVVADIADRVVVMRDGRIVETDTAAALFATPSATYTKALLAAVPKLGARTGDRIAGVPASPEHVRPSDAVLVLRDVVVEYGSRLSGRSRALDGVSFDVRAGEILGLVGESGSGKTTAAMTALGLVKPTSGSVRINGIDATRAGRRELALMRRDIGVVFQNPATSLNPRYSVAQSVGEPLAVHRKLRGSALDDRVDALLAAVGLRGDWRNRYPHELSGGQRQRVAIARAVSLEPALLIADEPTSALDVSVQAKVLDVFRALQAQLGFACLFVSHDLAVVESLCDRVAVMSRGEIVESGSRDAVLGAPTHPYTRKLIASAPVADPVEQRARRLARLAG